MADSVSVGALFQLTVCCARRRPVQKPLGAYLPPALVVAQIKHVCWHPSRPWLAVATGAGVFVYKASTQLWLPSGFAPGRASPGVSVTTIAWRPFAGDTLAIACNDGHVHLCTLDMGGREPPTALDLTESVTTLLPSPVHTLSWSPDGRSVCARAWRRFALSASLTHTRLGITQQPSCCVGL